MKNKDVEILGIEEIEKPAFTIDDIYKEFKSKITIGSTTFYTPKRFNWFNRFMIKLVFGFIVENIE